MLHLKINRIYANVLPAFISSDRHAFAAP